jgi:hypothetical protein
MTNASVARATEDGSRSFSAKMSPAKTKRFFVH